MIVFAASVCYNDPTLLAIVAVAVLAICNVDFDWCLIMRSVFLDTCREAFDLADFRDAARSAECEGGFF